MLQDAAARPMPLRLTASSTTEGEFPKIARDALSRGGLERWLKARASERVRVVRAPAGSGKTTGTVRWARSSAARIHWIDVPPDCDAAALDELFARATDACIAARLAGADGAASCVIALDQVDEASTEARESLRRAIALAPDWLRFIVIGRSQRVLDVAGSPHSAVDAAVLRFTAEDVARLCETHRVATTPAHIDGLLNLTSGWPIAVASAVRIAAFEDCALATALKKWRAADAPTIAAVVERALDAAAPEHAALLTTVLAEPARATAAMLGELASAGLFVDVMDGRLRLNPIVAADARSLLDDRVGVADADGAQPAAVTLFGEFRMCIGGRTVRFSRRRDRHLVQYLALRPDGRAGRDELCKLFWPHADRHARLQNLRTSCSMVRAAIARCCDRAAVDRYFRTDATHVALRVEHLAIDAQRFQAQIDRAIDAQTRGQLVAMRRAWRAAAALYTAPLLQDEADAPWFALYATEFAAAAARARAGG